MPVKSSQVLIGSSSTLADCLALSGVNPRRLEADRAQIGLTSLDLNEQLVEERQTQRTDGHTVEPHTDKIVDLQEYLYRSLDVTYPLLADGTTVLERGLTARRRVEEELALRL